MAESNQSKYTPHKGGCLSIPYNDKPHLFVILNDPCDEGDCLLVMVSSIKANRKHDDTCILNVGDHPYITKPSFLLYRMAERVSSRHISKMVSKKYYEEKENISDVVLERIIEGLFDSDETRGKIIKYAQDTGI
tara:strand:+ start:1170 stop:1571 length:402 start_codon:yes stop_codon:yes gene_type:complete